MAAHTARNNHSFPLPRGIHKANMPRKKSHSQKEDNQSNSHTGGLVDGLLSLAGSLLDLALLVCTKSAAQVTEQVEYWQEGCYFYSATGRSGESISLKQTRFLEVGFTYRLQGMQIQGVSGSHEMGARIVNEQSNWHRSLPLTPRIDFTNATWCTLSTLDLAQVEAIVAEAERQAGTCGGTYRVEIATRIRVNGLARGRYIMDDFEPELVFRYDQARLLPLDVHGRRTPMRFTKPGPLAGPIPGWAPSAAFQAGSPQWEGDWRWADPRG